MFCRDYPCSMCLPKISRKTSTSLICTCQLIKNISLSEHFAYVLNAWFPKYFFKSFSKKEEEKKRKQQIENNNPKTRRLIPMKFLFYLTNVHSCYTKQVDMCTSMLDCCFSKLLDLQFKTLLKESLFQASSS